MTNLNKEREEIIYELVLSLNNCNTCCAEDRVRLAINQYNDLIKKKIVTEWCEHDWMSDRIEAIKEESKNRSIYKHIYVCRKCGKEQVTWRYND